MNELVEFYSKTIFNNLSDFILNSIENNKEIDYKKLKEFINMNFNENLYKIQLNDENYQSIFLSKNNESYKKLYSKDSDFGKKINESFRIEKLEKFCITQKTIS